MFGSSGGVLWVSPTLYKVPSILDYKIPTFLEMPEIETILIESNDPEGPYGAEEARHIGLVDILSDKPDDEIRRYLLRLGRLDEQTTLDAKAYFQKMWLFNQAMEATAIAELSRLMQSKQVQSNIHNYAEH